MFKKFTNYCKTCYEELAHKTTWPTFAELTHRAVIVLSASLIITKKVKTMNVVFKTVMSMIYPN